MKNVVLFSGFGFIILTCFLHSCKKEEIPTLITADITSITRTSATCGGTIISDGGTSITDRGVCWSTTDNPTTANNKTSDDEIDSFESYIISLIPNTIYFVCAYATNAEGTGYGEVKSFTTLPITTPLVYTLASDITLATATLGGNITTDGGAPITDRGVFWGTSQNPYEADNKNVAGSGTGTFSISVAGLTPNTTYYVYAYATNSEGTSYGKQEIFKTMTSTITDIDGNKYFTVSIGDQEWMAQNLRVTKYNDGTPINKVTNTELWFSSGLNTAAYDDFHFNSDTFHIYGNIYNKYTIIESRKICPTGWHIPTDAEWTTLENFLGGKSISGGKLKRITGWLNPNTGATNESGFSAVSGIYPVKPYAMHGILLPAYYDASGAYGFWWSSNGNNKRLEYNTAAIFDGGIYFLQVQVSVYSVRCLRD